MSTWLSCLRILGDLIHLVCLSLRSRGSLAAENLFLRKQLAFYQERQIKRFSSLCTTDAINRK